MNKKAVTLTEILIALTVALIIIIPTTSMFSTSSRMLEKASNLTFASGLARYIIQGLVSARMSDIKEVPIPGISCCDNTEDNIYFYSLFNLKNDINTLAKGEVVNNETNLPNFYKRCAKYDFRYSITVGQICPTGEAEDMVKSVNVLITWKEFGVDKVYEIHAYIVPR